MHPVSLSQPAQVVVAAPKTRQPEATVAARKKFWPLARRIALPLAILITWEVVTVAQWVASASLPSPLAVAAAWWDWIFGPRQALAWYSGTWGLYVLMSLERVIAGFAIAAAAGVSLGVLIGWYAAVEDLFDGTINFLRAVPMTAWVPFAVFLFGIRKIGGDLPNRIRVILPHRRQRCGRRPADPAHPHSRGAMSGTPRKSCCCVWCCPPRFHPSLRGCASDSAWRGSSSSSPRCWPCQEASVTRCGRPISSAA